MKRPSDPKTLAEVLAAKYQADMRSKYGNEKVTVDGQTFDSEAEYRRYCELCLMAQAGEISDLQRQVRYELTPFSGTRMGTFLSARAFTSPISSIRTRTGAPSWRT